MTKYLDDGLDLTVYPQFLNETSSEGLFVELNNRVNFGSPRRPKDKFRSKVLYRDSGLIYTVRFRNGVQTYPVIEWSQLHILPIVKDYIEKLTGIRYNCCVIQRYPNGKVGMNPHRDKEMVHGTLICGLSVGDTRTLRMSRYSKAFDIPLPSGSLYIIHPPTNDYWNHQILTDESTGPRISLTSRNYAPQ